MTNDQVYKLKVASGEIDNIVEQMKNENPDALRSDLTAFDYRVVTDRLKAIAASEPVELNRLWAFLDSTGMKVLHKIRILGAVNINGNTYDPTDDIIKFVQICTENLKDILSKDEIYNIIDREVCWKLLHRKLIITKHKNFYNELRIMDAAAFFIPMMNLEIKRVTNMPGGENLKENGRELLKKVGRFVYITKLPKKYIECYNKLLKECAINYGAYENIWALDYRYGYEHLHGYEDAKDYAAMVALTHLMECFSEPAKYFSDRTKRVIAIKKLQTAPRIDSYEDPDEFNFLYPEVVRIDKDKVCKPIIPDTLQTDGMKSKQIDIMLRNNPESLFLLHPAHYNNPIYWGNTKNSIADYLDDTEDLKVTYNRDVAKSMGLSFDKNPFWSSFLVV